MIAEILPIKVIELMLDIGDGYVWIGRYGDLRFTNYDLRLQKYSKLGRYANKICIYQKKAVTLHAFLGVTENKEPRAAALIILNS